MADNNEKYTVADLISTIAFMLAIPSFLMWLFFLFMPNAWHYEYLGEVIVCNDGEYIVKDEENHSADTYDKRVIYTTEEGVRDTIYYGEEPAHGLFPDMSKRYAKENAWQYVYRYKTWTNHLIYLAFWIFFLIVSFHVYEHRDDNDFFRIELECSESDDALEKPSNAPNLKHKTNDEIIW